VTENIEMNDKNSNAKGVSPHLALVKAVFRAAVTVVLLFLGLAVVAWVCFWYYTKDIPKYTDDELYSLARECIAQNGGVEAINAELRAVLNVDWQKERDKWTYWPPKGSCMDSACVSLPCTMLNWEKVLMDGHRAMSLRFGCHSNYAYLVAVDPSIQISVDGENVRRIASNIAVVYDNSMLQHSFGDRHPWADSLDNAPPTRASP